MLSGSKVPTLAPAGFAMRFSQITSSGSTFQILAARTLSTGMPSSSAAIMLMEMREPATSVVPRMSVTEPSIAILSVPVVSPPRLNQKPAATPRPWPGGTGEL